MKHISLRLSQNVDFLCFDNIVHDSGDQSRTGVKIFTCVRYRSSEDQYTSSTSYLFLFERVGIGYYNSVMAHGVGSACNITIKMANGARKLVTLAKKTKAVDNSEEKIIEKNCEESGASVDFNCDDLLANEDCKPFRT